MISNVGCMATIVKGLRKDAAHISLSHLHALWKLNVQNVNVLQNKHFTSATFPGAVNYLHKCLNHIGKVAQ